MFVAFFCSIATALYGAAQVEPSPVVEFVTGASLLAVILWLEKDARQTGTGAVHDEGYFLVLA